MGFLWDFQSWNVNMFLSPMLKFGFHTISGYVFSFQNYFWVITRQYTRSPNCSEALTKKSLELSPNAPAHKNQAPPFLCDTDIKNSQSSATWSHAGCRLDGINPVKKNNIAVTLEPYNNSSLFIVHFLTF